MINKGFVDLLFILLCGTIVMLSQSVRLSSIPSDPAEADAQADVLSGNEIVVMVVGSDWVAVDDRRFEDVSLAVTELDKGDVVVIPADREVAHHRMVAVWNQVESLGKPARFGVISRGEQGK